MHCPKCGQELATETCDSVEIDVCPSCKGVWLDAGELGTIVESTGSFFHSCLRVIRGGRHTSAAFGVENGRLPCGLTLQARHTHGQAALRFRRRIQPEKALWKPCANSGTIRQ